MKKKKINILTTLLLLSLISGCNNINDNNLNKELTKMLEVISNPNITYHTDYLIYYYENTNINEIIELQRFDVTAKITDELYDMVAYNYGEDTIASYAHLEKDEEGFVSFADININNELVIERAKDGDGNDFPWEESVYYNMVQYLKAEDFKNINDNLYSYTASLEELPLTILHTAIPTSYFNMRSFAITIRNNEIESFIFQEKESSEVYENCMYGRRLTIKFEDIGTTTIERIQPYEEKMENIDLGLALENIKTKDNYTIKSEGILDDGSNIAFQETYITESDILQIQHTDEGIFKTGCHTLNNELYSFNTVDNYLLGQKVNDDISVSSFLPTFSFSKDVFEFIEEDNQGYKIYRPYASMNAILDYVDVLSGYSEAYYSPAGDIYFFVKDSKLAKIEFPVYIYSQADPLIAINRLTYSDIDSTSIDSTVWEQFVTVMPDTGINNWDDDAYRFSFELSGNNKIELTIGELFEKCLGSSTIIPYFALNNSVFTITGNYSSSDDAVYLMMNSETGIEEDLIENIDQLLIREEYIKDIFEDDFMKVNLYGKDDVLIEVIIIESEDYLEISFTLPTGDIFA